MARQQLDLTAMTLDGFNGNNTESETVGAKYPDTALEGWTPRQYKANESPIDNPLEEGNTTATRSLPRSQRRFAVGGKWLGLDADAVVDKMELWQLWCGISMGAWRVENNSNQVRSKSR